jgi:hypothetical protein
MRSVIRCGDRYLVGHCSTGVAAFVWSKRSYFAERFSESETARSYVRSNLASFGPDIDDFRIVRLKARRAK